MDGKTRKGQPWTQFSPRFSKEEAAAQDRMWLVLRNKTRRRIMDILSQYGGLLCVVEIAEVLEESPSLISSHLAMLRAVNLVTKEMYGALAYYSLQEEALEQYKRFLDML